MKTENDAPVFPGQLRKNDDVFIRGAAREKPFLFIYEQEGVEVVHGPSFRADREIFIDRCEEDGVDVTARRGGGGTVVLSPGVLVIIVVGEKRSEREGALDVFGRVHDGIIAALCKAGVTGAVRAGISDIAVGGKKILGSSLYMGSKPPLFYYQSSLMVSNNLTLLDRYLRHPPKEPEYRQGRSHSEFCTTLKELGTLPVDMGELAGLIERELRGLI
ncbi:MAG: hypothetical protein LBC70_08710 [Chitinispirillales bacterium]|jgi:lipoate-protein ligase A|nr:hypothetical protein [Chitinispirillales bacterium]